MRPRDLVGCLTILALGGCAVGLSGPKMPAPLVAASVADIRAPLASLRVEAATEIGMHWRFQDERGEASGPGTILFVPPDSLRFDVRGALGSGARAAVVIGDSGIWAEPAEDVAELLPDYDLLWAMIGQVRPPGPGDRIESTSNKELIAWRYLRGVDTIEYILTRPEHSELVVDVRRGGQRIGRVHTVFGADGRVARSRLDVPARPARLDLTFNRHRVPDSLPATLWSRPDNAP